jgi:hypothetical protein
MCLSSRLYVLPITVITVMLVGVFNVLHTVPESFVQVCLWAIVQWPCAVPWCVSRQSTYRCMLKIAGVVCPVSAVNGGWLKVGSHEEFFPVALVLGVKYPMHHNFLSIRS